MGLMARINAAQSANNQRADGYTNNSPVFAFQAECERLAYCDYVALRSVLAMARASHDAFSIDQLRAAYRAIAKV